MTRLEKEAHASSVWPRYAKNAASPAWTALQMAAGKAWTTFGYGNPHENVTHEAGNDLLRKGIWVETDANGNALQNTEAKRATSNPPQDPPRPPKQLPQPEASGEWLVLHDSSHPCEEQTDEEIEVMLDAENAPPLSDEKVERMMKKIKTMIHETNNMPVKNTDRELWRESDDRSQCSPTIHVTQDGHIGINVGGTVITRTIREWHDLAVKADLSAAGINMTEASNRLHNIVSQHRRAEPPQPAKEAHASPSREWISKMADGEDKSPSVSARNPDAVETQQEASGVERYKVPIDYIDTTKTKGYQHTEVVTAADHDRVVAEKDAEIAELKHSFKFISHSLEERNKDALAKDEQLAERDATIAELNKCVAHACNRELREAGRAEAAEAKCAELEKLTNLGCTVHLNAMQNKDPFFVCDVDDCVISSGSNIWESIHYAIYKIETGEDVPDQDAAEQQQLAAANERIREAYAIVCQLDNVYRRQSTESVGSFGVSQEVHLLLDRVMKILHKE